MPDAHTATAVNPLATIVNRADLITALRHLVPASQSKPDVPILGNVRISVTPGRIALETTNLDIWLATALPLAAPVAVPFDTTTDVRMLARVLPHIGGDTVSLQLAEDGSSLFVGGEAGHAKLPAIDARDWPAWSGGDATLAAWPTTALAQALAFCAPAISTEETRYHLNGLCLASLKARGPEFVATDGHRLHAIGATGLPDWPAGNPILPRATVALLRKLLAAHRRAETVGVAATFHRSWFEIGAFTLRSNMIEGSFPAYDRIFPETATNVARLAAPAGALLATTKALSAINGRQISSVRLPVQPGPATMATSSAADVQLNLTVPGSIQTIIGEAPCEQAAFNGQYLAGTLSQFGPAGVEMAITGGASPAAITSPDHPDRTAIIMPMRP